ncbi:signal peptidase II [Pseudarthrobacter sp. PS3-L1]|uniref:signal peptidase II n=1 Tax=Pseudarthrobacter sp. PS3-L1 TaxID=3046207 RepID=UPI0024BB3A5B|nr:signal peptidase II [Pseudarthrobacter sp. PS3-L1]MDJ0320377.1 signal peptidase II [Pseudarthrobacter sp. PS3-L1]
MTDQPAAEAPESAPAPRPSRRAVYFGFFFGFALFAYVFDQLTKFWVTSTMVEGERIAVLPPLLHWYFIRNSGAAFSIGENVTWIFTIIMAVVAIVILLQVPKIGSRWWALALGLLLGGALGNLTDRLFREPSFGMGHVVDFISFPNFAIFNIADSAVVSAVATIIVLTLLGINMDGSRTVGGKKPKESTAATDTSGSNGKTNDRDSARDE